MAHNLSRCEAERKCPDAGIVAEMIPREPCCRLPHILVWQKETRRLALPRLSDPSGEGPKHGYSKGYRMTLVLLEIDQRGVATATLNRPDIGNAYNEELRAS